MSHSNQSPDGNTWEDDVKRWLRLRYPNEFQEIPAADKGDGGIEGYCVAAQAVYQCYACLPNLSTRAQYEHQRDKLTRDVGKFINNSAKLLRLLPDGFQVRRYCYIVPEFRSQDLVAHAQVKTTEVLCASLPYATSDFQIIVQQREEFAPEQRIESATLFRNLQLNITEEPEEDDIAAWETDNNTAVQNLNRKIPLFTGFSTPSDIAINRRYWIGIKIQCDNALDNLRKRSPEAWDQIMNVRVARERLLGRAYRFAGSGGESVQSISDKVVNDMIEKVPNLENIGAETLADGLVSGWLQDCKLNFPDNP